MKNRKVMLFILMMATQLLGLTGCGSDSKDVPSLESTPTAVAADEMMSNEAIMMAFTECLREQGVEVMDPVVDSDGFVDKPEFVEGFEASKEELDAAMEVCEEILEGFTFEGKNIDRSEQIDEYLELAACLREEGFDIDEPTASTLETWLIDFKTTFDWDDPDTMEAYEICSGIEGDAGGGKGK
jgi:hypothetical protein